MSPYKTSEIAKLAGVHPNTVRLYEAQGYLSPVPRAVNGYRQYTPLHLEQLRLARLALDWPLPGVYPMMIDMVRAAAAGDLGRAMHLAESYLAHIQREQARAEAAVDYLERWARGQQSASDDAALRLSIGQAAAYLDVTADQLRNWDRSGLVEVPRDPHTGYRVYSPAQLGRLQAIRMLRQAGYSVMAILRMLRQLDAGQTAHLREALDTPGDYEAVETVADRWLTTLARHAGRAQDIIQHLEAMMQAGPQP